MPIIGCAGAGAGPLPRTRRAVAMAAAVIAMATVLGAVGRPPAAAAEPAAGDPVDALIGGDFAAFAGGQGGLGLGATQMATTAMEPNLKVGDLLLFDNGAYLATPVARGDIVQFRLTPSQARDCGASPAQSHEVTMVKRVIGVGGDRVVLTAGERATSVNGVPLVVDGQAPNPRQGLGRRLSSRAFDVPAGRLLILGDNRADSCDAHLWTNPFVAPADIRGRVSAIYFPRGRVARVASGGSLQPVDVSARPARPRFDFSVVLARATTEIGVIGTTIVECSAPRPCRGLDLARFEDLLFSQPTTTQARYLRILRGRLGHAIERHMRHLGASSARLGGDCAAPTARWLTGALGHDRRLLRTLPGTAGSARRVAVETQRHILRGLRRTLACWGPS